MRWLSEDLRDSSLAAAPVTTVSSRDEPHVAGAQKELVILSIK
jgi:hypothetical protein